MKHSLLLKPVATLLAGLFTVATATAMPMSLRQDADMGRAKISPYTAIEKGRSQTHKMREAIEGYSSMKPKLSRAIRVVNPGMPVKKARAAVPLMSGATGAEYLVGMPVFFDGFDEDFTAGFYKIPYDGFPEGGFESLRLSTWAIGTGHAIGNDYGVICFVDTDGQYFYGSTYRFYNLTEHRFTYNVAYDDYTELLVGVYDPKDCKVYCIYYDYTVGKRLFGTMSVKLNASTTDYESALSYTPIGEIDRSYAMAASNDGTIYLIGHQATGESAAYLYTIDKSNAAITKVGALGVNHQYITTATIDQSTGTLYYLNATDRGCGLMTVDTKTGKATKLYDIPDRWEFVGLHTAWREAAPEAPAAPSGLTLDFAANKLGGKVSFTAPDKDFSGENMLSGELSYTVLLDNEKYAGGVSAPGKKIELEMTVNEATTHTVDVYFSNEAGKGASAVVTQWIGWEDPAKISGISAEIDRDAHQMWVEWNEPYSATGEELDYSQLEYKVTLFPTGEVKTAKTTDITFELDEYPLQRDYYWAVVMPVYFGREYPARQTESQDLAYGEITLPWTGVFERESHFNDWTIKQYKPTNIAMIWKWDRNRKSLTIQDQGALNDDYAFSRRIEMKKGHVYDIEVDAACWSSNAQYLEVTMGTGADKEKVVATPIEKTEITGYVGNGYERLKGRFTCVADGNYYVGIHCVNPEGGNTWSGLYVNRIHIESGKSVNAPMAPTEISVVPDQQGEQRVSISYTAPVRTIDGKRLTVIDKVNIERNGEVIATMSPNPGGRASYVDVFAEKGLNTYTFVPYADGTAGESASAEVYVGYAVPADLNPIENTRTGHNSIHLSWPSAANDPYGKPYQNVKYEIWSTKGNDVVEKIKTVSEPEADITLGKPTDDQKFARFAIRAITDGGETHFTGTDFFPFGKPYDAPWKEDFNNGPDYPFLAGGNTSNTYGWELVTADEVAIAGRSDGHFMGWSANAPEYYYNYYTAFIKVPADLKNPVAQVDFYCLGELDRNVFSIAVTEDFINYTEVASTPAGQGLDFWTTLTADMTPYLGKEIALRVRAHCKNFQFSFIDNIFVGSRIDNDLALQSFTATEKVNAGEEIELNVLIENKGFNAAGDYSVEIYHDASLLTTLRPEKETASSGFTTLSHKVRTSAGWRPEATFRAKIVWDKDEVADNNESYQDVITTIVHSELPAAQNLKAEADTESKTVTLTWEEPSINDMPFHTRLFDFEDLPEFTTDEDFLATEICGWTSVDMDKVKMDYGHYFIDPIVDAGIPFGFFAVDDRYYNNTYDAYKAHSGHHYVVACRNLELDKDEPNPKKIPNDWFISPELCGNKQDMTFWVIVPEWRNQEDPTDFKVLVSETGREVEDFTTVVANYEKFVATTWTQLKVTLPEGAKYVAFNYNTSRYCEGLQIDDIDVALKGAERNPYNVSGYNIYRDGEKINSELLTELAYTDSNPGDKKHRYVVETIYDCGSGAPSNEAMVDLTPKEPEDGLDNVEAGNVTISGGKGEIIVTGAEGIAVDVYTLDGRAAAAAVACGETRIRVRSGIYVVRAGIRTAKVAVR